MNGFYFSHEGTKARRREGKGRKIFNDSRSQSPDWERTLSWNLLIPKTRLTKQSFADKGVTNLEIRNEESFGGFFGRVSRLRAFVPSCEILLALLLTSSAQAQITLPQQPGAPAASPTPELAPIAPPVPVFPYPTWMVATAAVLAVILLGVILWLIVRAIHNRPLPPPPTPRQKARAALENLRARIAQTEPYPFSVEVSDALRAFVTEEFQVRATRQTSSEFLIAASSSPRFSEADKALLAAFLEKADLIKFARLAATSADSEQLLEQACRFVEGGHSA
jgi:hypothetical protein